MEGRVFMLGSTLQFLLNEDYDKACLLQLKHKTTQNEIDYFEVYEQETIHCSE